MAGQAARVRHIGELIADVLIKRKRVANHCRHKRIRLAIIIHITKVYAQCGDALAVFIERDAAQDADFFEAAVALIFKQVIAKRIVRHKNIREAIAIVIRKRDAHAFANLFADAGAFGHIGERAVVIEIGNANAHPFSGGRSEAQFFGDFDKFSRAEIFIQLRRHRFHVARMAVNFDLEFK